MKQHNKYLPVGLAIELVTGTRPHPSTCWRWSTRGCGGVVLKTWMIGGRRRTISARGGSLYPATIARPTRDHYDQESIEQRVRAELKQKKPEVSNTIRLSTIHLPVWRYR